MEITEISTIAASVLAIGGIVVSRSPKLKNSKAVKTLGNVLRALSGRPRK